jgi:hypothetical protein
MAPSNPLARLDLATYQRELHAMSAKRGARRDAGKTKGAFGGTTKDNRMVKRITRRFGK